MMLTKQKLDKFYESLPNSFAEAHLDIRTHLNDNIFLLKNGDLGVFYRLNGIYDAPLTPSELSDSLNPFMKAFRNIVRGIPAHQKLKNTVTQLFCSQREIHSPIRESHFSDRVTGSILKTEEDVLFSNVGLIFRTFYIAIRYSPAKTTKHNPLLGLIKDYFDKQKNITASEEQKLQSSFELFKNDLTLFENQFSSQESLTRCNSEEYIQYVQNILHGTEEASVIANNDNLALSIYNSEINVEDNILKLQNNHHLKIYYLEQLPSFYKLGMFRHFMEEIPSKNWDLIWTFSDGIGEYDAPLAAKEGWYGRKASKRTEFEDFLHFKQSVDNFRPHGVLSTRLICYDTTINFDAMLESMALDYVGARMVPERQIPVHMLASSLPLNCSALSNKIKGRHRRIRLENAIAFLPIFTGPDFKKGFKWQVSRSGQPCSFDLFAGEGNKMTSVLGASRAGKSVLTNQLILEFLERFPDGIVRIIDKRTSYLKLADLLGGKIINFSEDALRKTPYSPFALHDWDEDDIENLFLLVLTAIIQKNPGVKITSIHSEILREAIKITYNNQAQNMKMLFDGEIDPHPVWDDILSNLPIAASNLQSGGGGGARGIDDAKEDVVLWTLSLTRTGQYGFIFSKHEKSQPTNDIKLLVYDLDGNSDPVLRQLSAMMAFVKISRDLARLPRSAKKLIIFEELGMLLYGDDAAQKLNEEFIQNVVKTCAKLNAQAIAITNNVDDYANKPAGKTLWENATQKIFLPLGGLYDNAYRAWKEQYNEAEWQILKSLKKESEYKRSAVFIKSQNDLAPWIGDFYIILTKAMDALTTSSGSQVEFYLNMKKQGMSPELILEKMWTDNPYGENL